MLAMVVMLMMFVELVTMVMLAILVIYFPPVPNSANIRIHTLTSRQLRNIMYL